MGYVVIKDNNLAPENIRKGIKILKVLGTYEGTVINNQDKAVDPSVSSQDVTFDAGYTGLGTVTVNPVTASVDANIQAENIRKDVTILGVTGTLEDKEETFLSESVIENGTFTYTPEEGEVFNEVTFDVNVTPSLQSKTVTPSTSGEYVNPDSGYYGLEQVFVNPVTASVDANITAGNIKKDVTILGVTGTLEGGGEYDFSWIKRAQDGQITDLSGYTLPDGLASINYGMYFMFLNCTSLVTAPDLSSITSVGQSGMYAMFAGCTSLTSAPDLSGVTSVGEEGMCSMFADCTSLTAAPDLSGITSVGIYGMSYMFQTCSSLTSVDLSGVTSVDDGGMLEMFSNCRSLSEIRVGWSAWPTASDALSNWVNGVSATGTFHCPPGLEEIFDESHIPVGWTVVDDVV